MTSDDRVDTKREEQGCMINEVTKTSILIILVFEPPHRRERMHEKRYEGTHGPSEVKLSAIRTLFGLQTSRGHDRDVDVYLPTAIVLTKRRMLSPSPSRVGRRRSDNSSWESNCAKTINPMCILSKKAEPAALEMSIGMDGV